LFRIGHVRCQEDTQAWADENPTCEVDPQIKILIDRLNDPDEIVRRAAVDAPGRITPEAKRPFQQYLRR
jgi:hypothetical protein